MDNLPWGMTNFFLKYEYFALFFLFFISEAGVPLPIPNNLLLIYAGYLASQGRGSVVLVALCTILGILVGATILYIICQKGGRRLLHKYGKYIKLYPERLVKVETWFKRWGGPAVFIGRLSPGVRIQTAMAAGLFQIPRRIFWISASLAASLWIALYIWLGFLGDKTNTNLIDILRNHTQLSIAVLVICLTLLVGLGVFFVLRRRRHRHADEMGDHSAQDVRS